MAETPGSGPWSAQPSLDREAIEAVVTAAAWAPSILNCQPWRFHAYQGVVDVFAVPEAAPLHLDPTCREVYLSLGAAVLNLRLAIGAHGRSAAVQVLPTPLDRTLVARVRIGSRAQLSAEEQALYDAIRLRRSSRNPFSDQPVSYEDLMRLQDAASVEGAHLDAVTGRHRSTIVEALHDADREQRSDPAVVHEVRGLTVGRERSDVGVPVESLGPRPLDPSAVTRDLALGQHVPGRPAADFEDEALLAVLLTSADETADWLRAGMALERVLLTATVRGLSVGILSHATEEADLRGVVRDPTTAWRHPQIVLRIGYGDPMPPTPRRPLAEILEVS
ncbi:MAG TPA: nitroreductase family protein [Actinomycetes bacterium]|nr:nitroreductase family protein [Actinomycetes bacterium]